MIRRYFLQNARQTDSQVKRFLAARRQEGHTILAIEAVTGMRLHGRPPDGLQITTEDNADLTNQPAKP